MTISPDTADFLDRRTWFSKIPSLTRLEGQLPEPGIIGKGPEDLGTFLRSQVLLYEQGLIKLRMFHLRVVHQCGLSWGDLVAFYGSEKHSTT